MEVKSYNHLFSNCTSCNHTTCVWWFGDNKFPVTGALDYWKTYIVPETLKKWLY